MPDIGLPLTSAPGIRPQEGAGRLVNAYVEKLGDGAQGDGYVRRRVPGLTEFARAGHDGCRGFIFVSGVVLAAQGTKLVKIEYDEETDEKTVTVLGDLGGSGPVFFAANNKSPTPDILAVTSAGVYTCTVSGAPSSFVDADLPQPIGIFFLDGYFIFPIADGRMFASGLNNTSISALDFATAQAKPGGLLRGVPFGQLAYMFGPKGIELWRNAGNASGFPFSRSTVIPLGLASKTAIAGFEDGFSAALIFVANDRRVWRIDGGAPRVISPPDVDRALAAVSDPDDIRALVFAAAGHAQCAITFAGTESLPGFTWVYDLSNDQWHERKSYEQPNWRAAYSVNAFDRWLVGDAETDHIGSVEEDEQEEYGQPLVWQVTSKIAGQFPNRLNIPRMDANFIVGQGKVTGREPIETRPKVRIDYSKDGGVTFSQPVERELGRTGESRTRINMNRLGLTGPQGIVLRWTVSDPVYVGLLNASFEVEARPR